jgi:hypothetical protein
MNQRALALIKVAFILVKLAAIVVMATQASQKFVYGGF